MYFFWKKIQIQKNTCIIAKYMQNTWQNTKKYIGQCIFFSYEKCYRGGLLGGIAADFFLQASENNDSSQ